MSVRPRRKQGAAEARASLLSTADRSTLLCCPRPYRLSSTSAILFGPFDVHRPERSTQLGCHRHHVKRSVFGYALTMATFDGAHSSWGPDADGRYPAIKIPLTVEQGTTVALSIPAAHQDQISLISQPSRFRGSGRYSVNEGLAATRFEGCESGDTLFNGGFIITGPGCYPIVVSTGDGQEHTVFLPIGVSGCG